MSGFASLLNQFKETTQAAASDGRSTNKRPRSPSFEQSSVAQPHHNERGRKQSKIHQPDYCYPSTTPVKTIYIACPANTETGGPEALHQLCHIINSGEYYLDDDDADTKTVIDNNSNNDHDEFGRLITNKKPSSTNTDTKGKIQLKAFMLYLRERSSSNGNKKSSVEQVFGDRSPRPSKYDKYNAPMMEHHFPPQSPKSNNAVYSSDLVIWPEVWTHLIDSLQQSETSSRYQSAIWWLSVNNNKGRFSQHQFTLRKDVLHLVQSAYARDYVQSMLSAAVADGKNSGSSTKDSIGGQHHVITVTEFIPYTSDEFPLQTITTKKSESVDDTESKSNLVVYNPAKGMHFTDEIIKRACGKQPKTESDGSVTGGGIRFCPIGKGPGGRERMTGEEVVELLKIAKVVSFSFSTYQYTTFTSKLTHYHRLILSF